METAENRIIVIGDIHGRTSWETITARHGKCRIVFTGDYCDPYDKNISDEEVISNLENIINFKKDNPENVILLLGNHDTHYFCNEANRGGRFNRNLYAELMIMFKSDIGLFQYAYGYDDLLFTHAGVSRGWFLSEFNGRTDEDIAEQINNPGKFGNNAKAIFYCGSERGGYDRYGGILWSGHRETEDYLPGIMQIAGHNRVREIVMRKNDAGPEGKTEGIIYCDCLQNGTYLSIDCNLKGTERFRALNIGDEAENHMEIRILP